MNYCNPRYVGDGQLSATDIQMVQRYYGTPAITGASLFVATERRSPKQRITVYDQDTHSVRARIDIAQDLADGLISDVIASPDGKSVYIVDLPISTSRDTTTKLVVIDTASKRITKTVIFRQAITDLQVSPDSKDAVCVASGRERFEGSPDRRGHV
jgi:hypothetical protein